MYVAFKQFDGVKVAMASIPITAAIIALTIKPELIFKWFGEKKDEVAKVIDDNTDIGFIGWTKNLIEATSRNDKKHDKLLFSMLSVLILMAVSMINDSGKYNFIYIPILNPVDFMLITIFLLCILLTMTNRAGKIKNKDDYKIFFYTVGLVVISSAAVRFVHNALGVPWSGIMSTAQAQTALTLTMATASVATFIYGSKKLQEKTWYIGAVLMGVVVCKLLFIDRNYMNAVSGIVSFIATGGLLVLVGYFAPMPPDNAAKEKQLKDDSQS